MGLSAPDTVSGRHARPPGGSTGVGGRKTSAQGGARLPGPPPHTTFVSGLGPRPSPPTQLPQSAAGTALRACFTSGVHVHTSTVPPPPQTLPHSVSALLFDETGRHVQGPLRPRPSRAPRAAGTLTPLVGLQLRFQVLGGHVELGLLALRRLGLALPAAAVEAAAEAAAAVAAGEEPAEHKQGLWARGRGCAARPGCSSQPAPTPDPRQGHRGVLTPAVDSFPDQGE